MARYLILRVLQAIGVLWAAFTVSFIVLFLLPSDPVSLAAEGGGAGTPVDKAAIAELQARYGLDQPVWEQYWMALTHAVRGDLGFSISTGQTVTGAIAAAIPSTLALATTALALAVVGGGLLAFLGVYTRVRWLRTLLLSLPPLGVAVPTFWVGLILLQCFSFGLPVFPAFGDRTPAAVVLPAITLAIPTGAVIAQVLANSLISTWREPFVEVAATKGASRWYIHTRHVFRLATVPTLTIAGVLVGELLAGSVVVETVFARAGVGRLTQTSVLSQDIPVVQGVVVLTSLVYVVVTLAVDIVYPFIDPRIIEGKRSRRESATTKTEETSEEAHV
ncbi:ABC transporter permease [Williamsia maris]|uniref:Peptide/nickel transport system permease protein n=1 Tax=Williamsia maris TaxID=72806 RepID=A0ABT1H9M2_9NOCA|nr:ABC transporter permease [Williamsia maris]MCP2174953.1 peptide/nickel transport system permease protein [Williamsia maris]